MPGRNFGETVLQHDIPRDIQSFLFRLFSGHTFTGDFLRFPLPNLALEEGVRVRRAPAEALLVSPFKLFSAFPPRTFQEIFDPERFGLAHKPPQVFRVNWSLGKAKRTGELG